MTSLAKALNPASVAVLGASDNPHKVGGRPIGYMKQYGFKGAILPVNPGRAEVQGLQAWPSLADLPQVADLAIVAIGGDEGVRMVEQCAAARVPVVVVMASGYGETGEEGRSQQRHMTEVCKASGTRLIGPNCQGVANFRTGAIANFATIFHEQPGVDGPVAIIGQSGAATQSIYSLAQLRGLHPRYVCATGNEADVTASELVLEAVQDPDIKAVVMYLEALTDPDTLAQAAASAAKRGVPLIVVKGGRTASGQRAASSHTGAMATEDRVIDAFFERHNIIRVLDPYEAISVAALAVSAVLPRGPNLVAMSNSGASCVMAGDTADELGMPLVEFDADVTRRLVAVMPAFSSPTNPIDTTGALLNDHKLFPGIIEALGHASDVHLLMVAIPVAGTGYDVESWAAALERFASERQVALAVAAYQDSVSAPFIRRGIVVYGREREAMDALSTLSRYAERRRQLEHAAVDASVSTVAPGVGLDAGLAGVLDEAQSLGVLRDAGVQTIPFELCEGPDQAAAAAARLGGPVVLKGCSPDILHKSEHGLVALNLEGDEAVREAAARHASIVQGMEARYSGVLVARMLKGGKELALGARVDPVFGPVVLVGDGGIYLEALKDFRLLVPPFTEADVARALSQLRIAPLLSGLRGESRSDVEAFCRMAVNLGNFVMAHRDRIASIDINPVKVLAAGQGAFALDGVVELADPA